MCLNAPEGKPGQTQGTGHVKGTEGVRELRYSSPEEGRSVRKRLKWEWKKKAQVGVEKKEKGSSGSGKKRLKLEWKKRDKGFSESGTKSGVQIGSGS
jgi:hypothetical protein